MKALIMKDIYVLWSRMRMFVLLLVAMSLVESSFNSVFIVVWCSLLPYTAMAYDERSHWNELAAMMPYSLRDVVMSKYALGWLCMGAALVMSVMIKGTVFLLLQKPFDLSTLGLSFFGGMIALAFTLPLSFRFGVERGRLGFMIVLFGAAILGGGLAGVVTEVPQVTLPLWVVAPVLGIGCTVISIPLSMKLYRID